MKRTSRLSYLTSLVVIILFALGFVSCEKEDSKAPQITVINDGPVDVTGGAVVKTAGASLRIGDTEIATWADDRTAAEMCKVTMEFDGKAINDGATLDKAGKLTLSVADEAGNSSSSSVTTTVDSKAPQIILASEEVNVFGGLELTSAGGALFIGENEIARWSDDKTSAEQCTVTVTLDGETISLGTVLDKAGVLKFVITDGAGNASGERTVTLTDNALNGLDALKKMSFTVDNEYDLTEIISTVNGFAISKVEILFDDNKVVIPDHAHFSSDRWGDASFIITISREDGKSEEIRVAGITISPLEFSAYSIDKADNTYIWGKSERVWSSCSFIRTGQSSETTSQATSSFTGKAYLATCANMLADPDISQQENHKILRSTALDGTVLLDGEYHFTTRQMNPGGTLYQFYSKMPETVSMSDSNLIPIEHSLHINSVIVGPGIVDENGTEVTKENYTKMLGKKLFIDPVKLYKYGHKAGDSIKYTEHLCCDSKGSGAQDKASEAYKSIISKTFTVKIQ